MSVAVAVSKTITFDVHLTNRNGFVIDITITMLLITINNMISNTNDGNDIITIAIIMIMASCMYTTIALVINDTTSSNINTIIKK
jgi:hypothetical protein